MESFDVTAVESLVRSIVNAEIGGIVRDAVAAAVQAVAGASDNGGNAAAATAGAVPTQEIYSVIDDLESGGLGKVDEDMRVVKEVEWDAVDYCIKVTKSGLAVIDGELTYDSSTETTESIATVLHSDLHTQDEI